MTTRHALAVHHKCQRNKAYVIVHSGKRKKVRSIKIDNPVMMVRVISTAQNRYYYYADALGSIRLLSDGSGVIKESYTHDEENKGVRYFI